MSLSLADFLKIQLKELSIILEKNPEESISSIILDDPLFVNATTPTILNIILLNTTITKDYIFKIAQNLALTNKNININNLSNILKKLNL